MLRKLKAVPHNRGLAVDPQGVFVAAVAASGLLQIWEMLDGKQVLARKRAGPEVNTICRALDFIWPLLGPTSNPLCLLNIYSEVVLSAWNCFQIQ